MCLFLLGLALLVIGYFFYGRLVERIVGMDDSRPTPAVTHADGVDFVELPHWKNMLIQLLNIAGVGPVIGVILGIKFGSIVFLIIPIGNILGGAVHDFVSGVMSLRNRGANLPALIKMTLGGKFYRFFAVFMVFLLLLVVAVFVNIPAKLIDGLVPSLAIFHWAVAAIFFYYIAATIFPVDQIIGRIYPFFGLILLIGTFAIFGMLVWQGFEHPALLSESAEFKAQMETQPIIPALFVTIACGILSGFHATQSPIIARTMPRESHARPAFYGMMVLEGAVGMVWAAGGLAIYNLFPELMQKDAAVALSRSEE
ncbi:MAG: carbon starvation CstA family protein, partial [Victivallaceae bacterium]